MCSLHREVQAELASELPVLQVSAEKEAEDLHDNRISRKMAMETTRQDRIECAYLL